MSSNEPTATVLYVEDHSMNIALMKRLFVERPAIELLVATNGASGRHLATTEVPQLLLIDVNLPDMSGEELIRQLQQDLKENTPPIVVLSGEAANTTIDAYMSLGVIEYLTKPYDINDLLEIIDRHCTP